MKRRLLRAEAKGGFSRVFGCDFEALTSNKVSEKVVPDSCRILRVKIGAGKGSKRGGKTGGQRERHRKGEQRVGSFAPMRVSVRFCGENRRMRGRMRDLHVAEKVDVGIESDSVSNGDHRTPGRFERKALLMVVRAVFVSEPIGVFVCCLRCGKAAFQSCPMLPKCRSYSGF